MTGTAPTQRLGLRGLATTSSARVFLLVTAMAGGALAISLTSLRDLGPGVASPHLPWWGIAIVFLLAEAYPIHLHFRSQAHSLSPSELGLVLGLFLAAPGGLLLGQLCGAAIALLVVRRQRPLKAAFNLAEFAFASCLALLVFHSLDGVGSAGGPVSWLAALAAAGTFALTGVALVSVAIAAHRRGARRRATSRRSPGSRSPAGSPAPASRWPRSSCTRSIRWALALLAAPAAICILPSAPTAPSGGGTSTSTSSTARCARCRTRPSSAPPLRELLGAARTMLSADFAEIILFEAGGEGEVVRSAVGVNGDARRDRAS